MIQAVIFDIRFGPSQYGHSAFHSDDPKCPNEAFFTQVDFVVDRCESLGTYVGMLPNWGYITTGVEPVGRAVLHRPLVNLSNARGYGRYLGERYRDRPVIWILGGNQEPRGKEEVFAEQAEGIAEGMAGAGCERFIRAATPHRPPGSMRAIGSTSTAFSRATSSVARTTG